VETVWKFQALDTLFFRDSHPMNAGETVWIESQFPPTGRTLQGAIRTAILNHRGVTYHEFLNETAPHPLKAEIGDANSLGKLSLTGPILFKDGLPSFPAPLDLVQRQAEGEKSFALLKPAVNPVLSDLGNIRFPVLPENAKPGYKPLSGYYVGKSDMEELLNGNTDVGLSSHLCPLVSSNRDDNPLICREPKMGLARDNLKKTAKEGNLYAIAPVRPVDCVQIAVAVEGLNESYYPSGIFIQRLGGEGKMAAVSVENTGWQLPIPHISEEENEIRFKIVCITPADMPGDGWLPDENFRCNESEGGICWTVNAHGASFEIISACIGKPFRQGGWNHAVQFPRPLWSFVPAGSVYFCQAAINQKNNVLALHGKKLGRQTEYGFGIVLVGRW
jgi:CRISPR-associated protein Cmr3